MLAQEQVTHMLNPNRDLLLKNFNSTVRVRRQESGASWAPFFISVLSLLWNKGEKEVTCLLTPAIQCCSSPLGVSVAARAVVRGWRATPTKIDLFIRCGSQENVRKTEKADFLILVPGLIWGIPKLRMATSESPKELVESSDAKVLHPDKWISTLATH